MIADGNTVSRYSHTCMQGCPCPWIGSPNASASRSISGWRVEISFTSASLVRRYLLLVLICQELGTMMPEERSLVNWAVLLAPVRLSTTVRWFFNWCCLMRRPYISETQECAANSSSSSKVHYAFIRTHTTQTHARHHAKLYGWPVSYASHWYYATGITNRDVWWIQYVLVWLWPMNVY